MCESAWAWTSSALPGRLDVQPPGYAISLWTWGGEGDIHGLC